MNILLYNVHWMAFNAYLAVLPLLFYLLSLKVKMPFFRLFFLLLWFLYLPNSIYVITDFEHLVEQWMYVSSSELLLLIVQYVGLLGVGLWAYLVGFYPIEYALLKNATQKLRNSDYLFMIFLHFLMGFAMVLGKVERVNSWEVFSNPERVYSSVMQVLQTPQLLILTLLFGLFANFFYFLLRKPVALRIGWFGRRHHQ